MQEAFELLEKILDLKDGHGACSDCDAEIKVVTEAGLVHVVVEHDTTCPWLAEAGAE